MIAKKVLLVGSFGVGKTSLIRRFVTNEFSEDYISTIGVRVSTKIMKFNNEEIKLLIWDVAGINDNEDIPSVVENNGDSETVTIGTGTPPSVSVTEGDKSAIDVVHVQEVCVDEDDDIEVPDNYMFPFLCCVYAIWTICFTR